MRALIAFAALLLTCGCAGPPRKQSASPTLLVPLPRQITLVQSEERPFRIAALGRDYSPVELIEYLRVYFAEKDQFLPPSQRVISVSNPLRLEDSDSIVRPLSAFAISHGITLVFLGPAGSVDESDLGHFHDLRERVSSIGRRSSSRR